MRPLTLRLKGLTSYREPMELDLTQLPPGLVAIVGKNGAGKTTLLDAVSGAPIYLELSTRSGTLTNWCEGKDAQIDLSMAYRGRTYRMLVNVNADAAGGAGKQEAFLFEDGVPVAGPGIRDYQAAIARIFPPRVVFLASAFGAQTKAGNFVRLSVPERKTLMASLLGLGAYTSLAERAKTALALLNAAAGELDAKGRRLDEDRAAANAIRAGIGELQVAVVDAGLEVAACQAVADAARKKAADSRALLDQLEEALRQATQRRADLLRDSVDAAAEASTAAAAIKASEGLREDDVGIRERAEALAKAAATRESILADYTRAEEAVKAAQGVVLRASSALARAEADVVREQATVQAAGTAKEALAAARAELLRLVGVRELRSEMEGRVRVAAVDLQTEEIGARAAASAAGSARARAADDLQAGERAASLVASVPCGGAVLWSKDPMPSRDFGELGEEHDCGTCSFLHDAKAAESRLPDLRAAVQAAEMAVEAAVAREGALAPRQVAVATLQAELAAVAQQDRQRAELEAVAARHEGRAALGEQAESALAEAQERVEIARVELTLAEAGVPTLVEARDALLARGREAKAEIGRLSGADEQLRLLERALAQLPVLEEREKAARAREWRAAAARDLVVVPPAPEHQRAECGLQAGVLRSAEAELADATEVERAARDRIAIEQGRLAQLGDVEARGAELHERREAVAMRRAGFVLIEQACGRDGIQALEIDAAGPEVNGLANELLEACFGTRFSVKLRTLQEAEKGRQQKEVFDLVVFDGQSGKTLPHDGLSEGEKVLVDEALKLALAIFNSRRHGAMFETLFRDEADGALDEEAAARFPAMLRRAMELGGFRNLLFVTHRGQAAEQADVTIRVGGGKAELDG